MVLLHQHPEDWSPLPNHRSWVFWKADARTTCCPATFPLPAACAPGTPPALLGGILVFTVTSQPDLSVGRLPAKLEMNFRSSGSFMWCGDSSAGNTIQSLGAKKTAQSNSFQSMVTWAGDEPIHERWEALQSSCLQFPLACRIPTTSRSFLSQGH